MRLFADELAVRHFSTRRIREAVAAALVFVPAGVAILAIDIRLMLFAIVAFGIALVVGISSIRARSDLHAWVAVELDDDGVLLTTPSGGQRVDAAALVVRVTPDAIYLLLPRSRGWIVPGPTGNVAELGRALASAGARVSVQPALIRGLVMVLGGSIVAQLVHLVGYALVAVGLASIVLGTLGEGGSWSRGLAFLGGACGVFVIERLVVELARRASRRVKSPPA